MLKHISFLSTVRYCVIMIALFSIGGNAQEFEGFKELDLPLVNDLEIRDRQKQLYKNYEEYYKNKLEEIHASRPGRWHRDFSSLESYEKSIQPMRDDFLRVLGGWPWERGNLEAEIKYLFTFDGIKVSRIWITIFENVRMDCLLLLPPGTGKRPAVLAQHGWNATPEIACGFTSDAVKADYSYLQIGARLAREGFIVIAPHMVGGWVPWGGDNRFVDEVPDNVYGYARTRIQRYASLLEMNLMGAEMFALSRAVDYLLTIPEADHQNIGMYGLSQGGTSALYFPALDTRIKASVSSAYFNQRDNKMLRYRGGIRPYIDSFEEDRFTWAPLVNFSDSDIASLICPRAFFAENGMKDTSVYWKDARDEFTLVKKIYDKLGIPDRAEIHLHPYGHVALGTKAIPFLKKHLGLE